MRLKKESFLCLCCTVGTREQQGRGKRGRSVVLAQLALCTAHRRNRKHALRAALDRQGLNYRLMKLQQERLLCCEVSAEGPA